MDSTFVQVQDYLSENEIKNIDFESFVTLVGICQQDPKWAVEAISDTYAVFDRNLDGDCDVSEFKRVFSKLLEQLPDKDIMDQMMEMKEGFGDNINMLPLLQLEDFHELIKKTTGADFVFEND